MDDRTVAQIAPSGNFGNTFFLNCDYPAAPTANAPGVGNPLLSAQQRNILLRPRAILRRSIADGDVGTEPARSPPPSVFIDPTTGLPYNRGFAQILRRNVEGGGRRRRSAAHQLPRSSPACAATSATPGPMTLIISSAQTNFAETYPNDFSVTRLGRALDVVDNPRTPGVDPVCRSVARRHRSELRPLRHLRHRPGDAGGARLSADAGLPARHVQQTVASASLTGNLGELGHAIPLGARRRRHRVRPRISQGAAGASDRRRLLDAAVVRSRRPGRADAAGLAATSTSARRSPRSASRSSRTASSTTSRSRRAIAIRITASAPAASAPTPTSRRRPLDRSATSGFRGAYNRAVRAPNIQELFAPQRVALERQRRSVRRRGARGARSPPARRMGVSAVQYGTSPATRPASITA